MSSEKEEIITEPVRQIICAKCGKPLDVATLAAFAKFRCGHCNAVQTVPAKLGNFILQELLGRGGMGAVYRGVDQALGRAVAVKVMLRSVAADRVFFEQFKREARAAAALNHPNIVQVYSLDEEKGQYYIVMELLSGGRFDHNISKGKQLDEATVLKVGIDVAEGLNAANRVGLIHDDIKPDNILFDTKGVAKVVDFGLARFRGKGGPQAGANEIWGTPYYISPEKVLRKQPDFRSDIYSLGGTLFHALAGRPPFEGETAVDVVRARLQGPAPSVQTFRAAIRPEFAALLARMLERDPDKRPASYAELLGDLRQLAGEESPDGVIGPAGGGSGKSSKILIKGKKKSSTGSDASEADEKAEEAKPKRKWGKKLLIIAGALVLLAAVGGGTTLLVLRKKAQNTEAGRAAAWTRLRDKVRSLADDIARGGANALNAGQAVFFYDVEATNRLASAKAVIESMGDHAKLVAVPVFPTEGAIARRVEAAALGVFAGVTNLEALCAEAAGVAADVEKGGPAQLDAAKQAVKRLEVIRDAVPDILVSIVEASKLAGRLSQEMTDWIRQAVAAKEAGAKAAERAAADAAARKQREAVEKEKKRREAEYAAKVAAEREVVGTAWTENGELVKQNKFAEALKAAKGKVASLETSEAKEDAKVLTDRLQILQEMKDHLVAAIKEKPLRWGWYTVGGQIDITTADEQGITVRGKVEPWTSVDARQMLKFIDVYVKSEDAREKKGKRGWARLQLGAALYCYLQGERAYALARTYAEVAVQQDPKLEADTKRFMPELSKGGS
ncbi:MAG: protein kinase [Kiritimatiellia bacterium]